MNSAADYIRDQMSIRGWTQADLAFVLGVGVTSISQILTGRRGVSTKMAIAMAGAFETDPKVIARLQVEQDVEDAEPVEKLLLTRAAIQRAYPLREMLRRDWIDGESDPESIEKQVCEFFGIKSLDDIPEMRHAAKRTSSSEDFGAIWAWVCRARKIAEEMPTPTYSASRLELALTEMKSLLRSREETRKVPKLLRDAGVRYVIVEGLPSSKIDGACFWLDDNSPVIAMSLRFDRIDNFWFVLAHECAHVLNGHGKTEAKIDYDLNQGLYEDSPDEAIANSYAAEYCVPQKRMDSFYMRKNPFFSEKDVLAFSKILGVHPGLIVGQLQRRIARFNFLRAHQVKVSDYLLDGAMTDGFGRFVPVG